MDLNPGSFRLSSGCLRTFLFALFLILGLGLSAQDSLIIAGFHIDGNRKTRDQVILREMTLSVGQKVHPDDLDASLTECRRLLANTALFLRTAVHRCPEDGTDSVHVCITVREAWYIFPVPIFELADRNFNVWWTDYHRDADRLNYGMYLTHYNLTGWRDRLRLKFQKGYAEKYEVFYDLNQLPGLREWGAGIYGGFQRRRELQFDTRDDRQVFYRDFSRWMIRQVEAGAWVRYRPGFLWKYTAGMEFRSVRTDPLVASDLNPGFFPDSLSRIRFLTLWARAERDRLDDLPYPFHGHAVSVELVKEGLGVFGERDRLWLDARVAAYLATGSHHGFEFIGRTRVQGIRTDPGFFEYTALGFGDRLVRGYEHYVIDGMDLFLAQAAWRIRMWDGEIPLPWPNWFPIQAFRTLPMKVYAFTHTDHGVVHDPFRQAGNPLRNRWLASVGAGVDLRFFYDKVFTLRWDINRLGENGLFLHTSFGF